VILSLLCLLVAELSSAKSPGPVMAIGVALGLCAMITLLVIFGRWVFWPLRPTLGSAEPAEPGVSARTGARVARRPRLVWVVLALPAPRGDRAGRQRPAEQGLLPTKPEAVLGEAVLPRHFPAAEGNRSRSSAGPRPPASSSPPCPPPPGSRRSPR